HTRLLLLHLNFGGCTHFDQRNTAGEPRDTFLELLLVVVAGRFLGLLADRLDAALDVRSLAGSVDDGRGLFLAHNLLRVAKIVHGDLLERQADLIGNHGAAGQGRDVLQHRLATIAEARRLHRCNLEDAADVVDDQRRERLALDVLSDHDQRTARLRDRLQEREHLADIRDLLIAQENQRLFELGRLTLLLVDEIRGQIAAVELHAIDHLELIVKSLALFDGDDTFLTHLRAHVLEFVFELDLLRNRNTVLRDGRSAVALLEHRVAALRAECHLHRIRKDVDALEHALARIVAKSYFFGCHCRVLRVSYFDSITAMTSSSRMTTSSSPSTFTSVPVYLPKRILSPTLTSQGRTCPFSRILPLPTATIFPRMGFSAAVSGITMPPGEVRSSSKRFTMTRSWRGRIFITERSFEAVGYPSGIY